MFFKSDRVNAEWHSDDLNAILRQIVSEAASYASARHDWEFFLTCIHRTPMENDVLYGGNGDHLDGVHVEWRGVDVRTWGIDPGAVLDVATFVNDRWRYDPSRPGMNVALIEGDGAAGSSARHLHLQVSPKTVLTTQDRASTITTT